MKKILILILTARGKSLEALQYQILLNKKLIGIKFISGKMGAAISLAAIAPTDSAENYFNEALNNQNNLTAMFVFPIKLIDSKNIYQLYEFSCPTKKILDDT